MHSVASAVAHCCPCSPGTGSHRQRDDLDKQSEDSISSASSTQAQQQSSTWIHEMHADHGLARVLVIGGSCQAQHAIVRSKWPAALTLRRQDGAISAARIICSACNLQTPRRLHASFHCCISTCIFFTSLVRSAGALAARGPRAVGIASKEQVRAGYVSAIGKAS